MKPKVPNILHSKTYIVWELAMLKPQTDLLKEYVADGNKNVISFQKKFNKMMDKKAKTFGDDTDEFYEFHLDSFHKVEKEYPDLFYKATLIYLYGYFENYQRKICIKINEKISCKKSLKDYRNNAVGYKLFLQENLDLDLSFLDEIWGLIDDYRIIRNSITHTNAEVILKNEEVKLEEQAVYIAISKRPKDLRFEMQTDSFRILRQEYLQEFINLYYTYLKNLFEKIKGVL